MKKLVVLSLLAAFGLTTKTYAQQGIHLGIKIAPASTWLLNSDDAGISKDIYAYKSSFGFQAGIQASYFFSDFLGAGADFLYTNHVQNYTFLGIDNQGNNRTISAKKTLTYLKIPVLVRFQSSAYSPVMFNAEIGPQFSLLLDASNTSENSDYDWDNSIFEYKDLYNPLNIGVVLGFGIGFNLTSSMKLTANLRLDYHFTDAENKDHEFIPGAKTWDGIRTNWDTFETYNTGASTNAVSGAFEIGFKYVIETY